MSGAFNSRELIYGTQEEQLLLDDLINEVIDMWGQDFYYIPRKLVGKDGVFGEDAISEFKSAYPIKAVMETEALEGIGPNIAPGGFNIDQSASIIVGRSAWDKFVGRHGETILPNRPVEGDLLWYPLSNALFLINFVNHQHQFYAYKALYTYALSIELFQYSSEKIDTGNTQIDNFEKLYTQDEGTEKDEYDGWKNSAWGGIKGVNVKYDNEENNSSGYSKETKIMVVNGKGDETGEGAELEAIIEDGKFMRVNVVNPGRGYTELPVLSIEGDGDGVEKLVPVMGINKDDVFGFGDNEDMVADTDDIILPTNNPLKR